MVEQGKKIEQVPEEVFNRFAPVEGVNCVYYGKVRNGKTRTATADILELLRRGEIVYANWMIDFKDFDERSSFAISLVSFLFGRRYYFKFKKENFHYVAPQDLIDNKGEVNIAFLGRLVGVHLFLDEAQWILNSMERYNPDDPAMVAKLKLILHGGHYCRTLNVITQRPANITKNIRSQIHFWYRCVKRFDAFGLMIFQRWCIEDMKDDMPVEFDKDEETGKERPLGELKTYWVNKRHDPVFAAYNTHGMRGEDAIVKPPEFDVYELGRWDRFKQVVGFVLPRRKRPRKASAPVVVPDTQKVEKKRTIRQIERVDVVQEVEYRQNVLDLRGFKRVT